MVADSNNTGIPPTGENNPDMFMVPPTAPVEENDPETLIRTSWVQVVDGIRGQPPAAQQTLVKLQDLFLAKKNRTMTNEDINTSLKKLTDFDIPKYCDSVAQLAMNKIVDSIARMK